MTNFKNINNQKQRERFINSLTDEEREALEEQLGIDVFGKDGLLGKDVLKTLNEFGYKSGFYGPQNNLQSN